MLRCRWNVTVSFVVLNLGDEFATAGCHVDWKQQSNENDVHVQCVETM